MGTFGNSFKRELGKNTGKFVSNIIFGDKHSTPYRHVGNHSHNVSPRSSQTKSDARLTLAEAKAEMLAKNQLNELDAAVLHNIDLLNSVTIPSEKNELVNLLNQLTVQVEATPWIYNGGEEADIRNKYWKALHQKYKIAIKELELLSPEDPHLSLFKDVSSSAYRKRLFKRAFPFLIILVGLLLAGIGTLYEENPQLFNQIMIGVLGLSAVFVVCFIVHKLRLTKKCQRNKEQLSKNSKNSSDLKKSIHEEEKQQSLGQEDCLYIDINSNHRIEKQLASIWCKYRNLHFDFLSRRPIFSNEAVEKSILFVGITPLYNPQDDVNLTSSSDGKSLYYGSFYLKDDSPAYFRELEDFASRVGLGYSHINLLYARENDLDKLLTCNEDFIREQLELTYDTIVKIKPSVIVFFSDFCKNLIYGADRWVNPSTERDGHYILNLTDIPVFFTDDITILNAEEQDLLVRRIRTTIK